MPSPPTELQLQDEYLHSFGLQRHRVLGDGNCLFRAVSFAVFGDEDHHDYLRQNAVRLIQENPNDFSLHFMDPNENPATEIERLRQTGQWAGQESIIALSRFLRLSIFVTISDDSNTRVSTIEHSYGPSECNINIAYSLQGGGHYDAIVEHHTGTESVKLSPTYKCIPVAPVSPSEHAYASSSSSSLNTDPAYCHLCSRSFSSPQMRQNHMKVHQSNVKCNVQCVVPTCQIGFKNVCSMMQHLRVHHDANVTVSNHDFENEESFLSFKSSEQEKKNCIFVKNRGVNKKSKSTSTVQYVCHRDGKNRIHLKQGDVYKGSRALNKKGSCKLDRLCPARFYVTYYKNEDRVSVCYIHDHTHSTSFNQSKFVPIPQHIRDEIAIKLAVKIPINNILDTIRQSFNDRDSRDTILQRIRHYHFIDRKAIKNIEHSMKDLSYQLHTDNATSVFLKVQSLTAEKNNPILFYKRQGETIEHCRLDTKDFMLVIMTNEQARIFSTFSDRILCMDSTHKTNEYRFKLITLMVPDEFRKGYPVAFCISTTETTTALEIFLQTVKQRCPDAHPKILMTDDDCAGIQAAKSVFGQDIARYLCVWHVHQAWRRKLRSITDNSIQINMYSYMCSMLEAKTTDEYTTYYDNFVLRYQVSHPDFVEYFKTNYGKRAHEWALCYRTHEYANVINTNVCRKLT